MKGLEILLGDKSHIFLWEQGGVAQVSFQYDDAPHNYLYMCLVFQKCK